MVAKKKQIEGSDRKYSKEPAKLCLRKRGDGRQVVYLEIYLGGKRTYERLPDLVMLPELDESASAVGALSEAERLAIHKQNEKIIKKNDITLRKAQKLCRQRNKELKAQIPANKYVQEESEYKQAMMLLGWMNKYYDIQKSRGVRNLYVIKRVMRTIVQYNKEKLGMDDVALANVDKNYCIGYVDFLRSGYRTRTGEPLSSKSGFNFTGELNTALNTAVREGMIRTNPMMLLTPNEKIQPREAIREYLTIDEVKALIQTPCDCPIVKQGFLFACNCGLRLGDVMALRWKNIVSDDGVWRIDTRQIKTENLAHISLPMQARQWMPPMPKTAAEREEKVFPKLTPARIEKHLKPWVEAAGIIGKNVTFHTSRHTYATMLLTLGADLYTVSKLLGHTSVRHTQRYAKIVNKKIDDAVNLIDGI